MSLLFETIRIQDGIIQNLDFHASRLNYSRKALLDAKTQISLEVYINIPAFCTKGIFKCKVLYGLNIEDVTYEPYIPRKIKSLRLVEDDLITYSYKYSNRGKIDELFAKKGDCDDILIVKKGQITDTSFSNILFKDGNQWVTPANPLMQGTMRSFLLKNLFITEREIKVNDLYQFQKAMLVNAMLPLETGTEIEIGNIFF
jgi:4-amino-4-deoxychorismate lyase